MKPRRESGPDSPRHSRPYGVFLRQRFVLEVDATAVTK